MTPTLSNKTIFLFIFVDVSHQTGLDKRSTKVGFKWGLGEGKVGFEPRLEPGLEPSWT